MYSLIAYFQDLSKYDILVMVRVLDLTKTRTTLDKKMFLSRILWTVFGTRMWDPNLDPKYGPRFWTPNMDPLFYSTTLLIALYPKIDVPPISTPNNDPQFGTPIWDPDLDPKYGSQFWTPNILYSIL
jgi:hypothetical protein